MGAGKNPAESQFSVYGSGHVGIFGSIVSTTEVPGILRSDLLATDFFHDAAYPTYLYYNPYGVDRTVTFRLADIKWDGVGMSRNDLAGIRKKGVDLYNTVTGKFIAHNVSGSASIRFGAKEAAVIVCVPSGGKITRQGKKMLVDGVVVDYLCNLLKENE